MKQLDHSSQRCGAKCLQESEGEEAPGPQGFILPRNSTGYLNKGEAALGAVCVLRIIS